MSFLFEDAGQADALADAARSPAVSLGTTPSEQFSSDVDVYLRTKQIFKQQQNENDVIQSSLDKYYDVTGERLHNPMLRPVFTHEQRAEQAAEFQRVRGKFTAKAAELGRDDLVFPTDDQVAQGGIELARKALAKSEQLAQGEQQFGTGLASLGATLVTSGGDPVNALAMSVIPPGGGLAARMLGVGGAFGGAALLQDLSTYGFDKAVNPQYGPGDIAKNVALSAAGGAGLELGGFLLGKATGAIWRRVKTAHPEIADAMPRELQDAGQAAERAADLEAQNPYQYAGAAGEAAHAGAIGPIERDLHAGNPFVREEAEPAAIGSLPADMRPIQLLSEEASLRARAADLEGLRTALPEGDAAAAEQLARLDQVERQLGAEGISAADRRALSDRRDQLLEKVTPEQLRAQAFPLERGRSIENEQAAIKLRLDEIAAEQRQIEARQALSPFPRQALGQASRVERGAAQAVEPRSMPIVPHVYDDAKLVPSLEAHADPGVRRVGAALKGASLEWDATRKAALADTIGRAQDITPDLTQAVRAIVSAHELGLPVGEFMNRGPIFHSDMAQQAVRLFYKDRALTELLPQKEIERNLNTFARQVREGGGLRLGQPGLPEDIGIVARAAKGGAADRVGLAAVPPASIGEAAPSLIREATSPEALAAAHADPRVLEAADADLRRSIEQGNNRVPVMGADGEVKLGFADKELADIERQGEFAAEIQACAIPVREAA